METPTAARPFCRGTAHRPRIARRRPGPGAASCAPSVDAEPKPAGQRAVETITARSWPNSGRSADSTRPSRTHGLKRGDQLGHGRGRTRVRHVRPARRVRRKRDAARRGGHTTPMAAPTGTALAAEAETILRRLAIAAAILARRAAAALGLRCLPRTRTFLLMKCPPSRPPLKLAFPARFSNALYGKQAAACQCLGFLSAVPPNGTSHQGVCCTAACRAAIGTPERAALNFANYPSQPGREGPVVTTWRRT
jgi:hypothetical protein